MNINPRYKNKILTEKVLKNEYYKKCYKYVTLYNFFLKFFYTLKGENMSWTQNLLSNKKYLT